MVPSKSLVFIGGGDFDKTGDEFLEHFIKIGKLKPDDKVLDIGSGIGRMTIPLTTYLSPKAEYWGMDIVKYGIKWCQSRITPRFNNFKFIHSNIFNFHYNPNGKGKAVDYKFPFEDNHFDFIF